MVGISIPDGGEGYTRVVISPVPNRELGYADVGIKTRRGDLSVRWTYQDDGVRYEISVPKGTVADLRLPGVDQTVGGGNYTYICKE